MRRALWWTAGTVAGFLILRALGEDTALLLFGLTPEKWAGTLEVLLVAGGVMLASVIAIGVRLTGRDLSDPVRYMVAAVAAFYCAGLSIGGLPDWNPLWMILILAACVLAGVSVLRSGTHVARRL